MSNVVAFNKFRIKSEHQSLSNRYSSFIYHLGKLDLLEEMVRFQERRSRDGNLSPEMMVEGKILFKALNEIAETEEMAILTKSYLNHLNYEYAEYLKKAI